MRDSWGTRRFWFDYGIRKSLFERRLLLVLRGPPGHLAIGLGAVEPGLVKKGEERKEGGGGRSRRPGWEGGRRERRVHTISMSMSMSRSQDRSRRQRGRENGMREGMDE